MRYRGMLVMALCLASATSATAATRTLDVLPSVVWHHARTGLTMPPALGSLPRNEVGDFGKAEADLFVQYRGTEGTEATVYVFHPGLDSVPLWFDRIRTAIATREKFGTAELVAPTSFPLRPGAPAAGLRATYALKGSSFRATAEAVAPVGDWLVVVRLSSPTMDAGALDTELTAILAGIGWPTDKMDAPAAEPVKPCTTMPVFRKAKLIKPDMMQALLGAVMPGAIEDRRSKDKASIPTYCRAQEGPDGKWAVYKVEGEEKGYVLALGDAGRAIGVQPSIAALVNKSRPAFSLTYMDLTEWRIYPDVSEQLPPEQALDIVEKTAPISAANTLDGKKSITIGNVGGK